jgi:S1-C subfamily serine protease
MTFECPICESLFDLDADANTDQVQCPQCGKALAVAQFNQDASGRFSESTLDRVTEFAKAYPPLRRKVPTQEWRRTTQESNELVTLDDERSTVPPAVNRVTTWYANHRRTARLRTLRSVLLSTVVLAAAAVLVTLLAQVSSIRDRLSGSNSSISSQTAPPARTDEAEQRVNEPLVTNLRAANADLNRIKTIVPMPRPENRIITQRQLARCWERVRQHVLELRADTPLGEVVCTGVIVDSRGWVVANYRPFQGANQIRVVQAARSTDDVGSTDLLRDFALGYLAVDPDHDLILLAVNRRFVVDLMDLEIDPTAHAVPSQYVVQCTPPTQRFPWPAVESRIESNLRWRDLTSDIRNSFQRQQFGGDEMSILVHRSVVPQKSGSPLFNNQGLMVAINTSIVDAEAVSSPPETEMVTTYAVPMECVSRLKSMVDTHVADAPHPLPIPEIGHVKRDSQAVVKNEIGSDGIPGAARDAANHADVSMPFLGPDAEFHDLSVELNFLGHRCNLLDWKSENADQQQLLTRFIERLSEVQSARTSSKAIDENPVLERQTDFWLKQIRENLLRKHQSAQESFNLPFFPQPPDRQVFFGFATVRHSAMESPRLSIASKQTKDTVILGFHGTNELLIANIDENWPPLLPESNWFVIGKSLPDRMILKTGEGDQRVQFAAVQLLIESRQ